ncbi:MAG TPA: chemotaxis protein CheW [Acidobacteriota bacterium]|nr:chemotaxis protein CheW [Acidobacteriota bacterium]
MTEDRRGATTDWDDIYRRLNTTQAAIEQTQTPSGEISRQILRNRARQLALEPPEPASDVLSVAVIEFCLASETYGIELTSVREIIPLKELTPVPCTPPFVLGLMNIRGQLLSVISLKKFFQLPEKGLTDLNKVIVVSVGGFEIGILADAVLTVKTILLSEIQPAIHTFTGIHAQYLKGITREQTILLNLQELVTDQKLIISEQVDG